MPHKNSAVLLVEPNASGHHISLYANTLLPRLLETRRKIVFLTTRPALDVPGFNTFALNSDGQLKFFFLREPANSGDNHSTLSLMRRQLQWWLAIRKATDEIRQEIDISCAYFLSIDFISKAIELLGSPLSHLPFSALYLSPKHHRRRLLCGPSSRSDLLYRYLFRRLLKTKNLARLLVIDESFYEYALATEPRGLTRKLCFAPDFAVPIPFIPQDKARRALNLPKGKVVTLLYGAIGRRKGLNELLQAASASQNYNLAILVAGIQTPDATQSLTSPAARTLIQQGRLFVRPHFHNSEEECLIFRAANIAWLGYVDFYASSGFLIQAVASGLTIIGSHSGLIGKHITDYNLGYTCDPRNHEEVVDVLRNAIHELGQPTNAFPKERFLEIHTAEKHMRVVLKAIDEACDNSATK